MPQRSFVIDVAGLFVDGQVPDGLTITGQIQVTGPFFGGVLRLREDAPAAVMARQVAERIEAAIKGAV